MPQAHAMSQTHAAVISPLEGEAPQRACSPLGDFPRAARTSVLLAVMLIVFLSACGGNSAPETENGTQQEAPELADDSADNTSADNTSADNTSADNTSADNTSADNTSADNTEADNTEADNTEADNTEADNTEADNTEADNTEEIPSEEFAVPECDDEASRTDRASLTALYNATDGPNWGDNTNWLTDAPLSEWAGVDSLSVTGSECVTLLDLARNLLIGEIPAELGNLTTLQHLNLHNNHHLSGEIPAELSNLTTLEALYLHNNQLSGCIPASMRDFRGAIDIDEMPYCDG